MAFTQAQWYAKLKSFVPGWIFEKDGQVNAPAVYNGAAKVLAGADTIDDYFWTQTFIQDSENPYLAIHGFERGLTQLPLESDANFALRIANLKGTSDLPDLRALVETVLLVKGSIFREHYAGGPCLARGSFLNRYEIIIDKHYNWFSVIVPPQKHVPYSFLCHGNGALHAAFCARGNFAGESGTLATGIVMSVVDEILQVNKSFGVGYRLFEATH